jgi:hypothetical protein
MKQSSYAMIHLPKEQVALLLSPASLGDVARNFRSSDDFTLPVDDR